MSMQFKFYATTEDLLGSLQNVERNLTLRFFDAWVHKSAEIPKYDSLTDWSQLGISPRGREGDSGFFLVTKRNTNLQIACIEYEDGTKGYHYSPESNRSGFVLKPSGVFNSDGTQMLISGMCGTAMTGVDSRELYQAFRKMFLKGYTKIKNGAYIGKNAAQLLADETVVVKM